MSNVIIKPLTSRLYPQTAALADSVFPDNEVPPSVGIRASLDDSVRIDLNTNHGGTFNWFKYWVAVDEHSRVIGVIGLYEEHVDADDSCWIGWYCVRPENRGKGIGVRLLKHVIAEAKLLGKKNLLVYTSETNERLPAMGIYARMGFKPFKTKNTGEENLIYFGLKLD